MLHSIAAHLTKEEKVKRAIDPEDIVDGNFTAYHRHLGAETLGEAPVPRTLPGIIEGATLNGEPIRAAEWTAPGYQGDVTIHDAVDLDLSGPSHGSHERGKFLRPAKLRR